MTSVYVVAGLCAVDLIRTIEGLMDANTKQLRRWYAEHAAEFEDAATIQPNRLFQQLDAVAQQRLNDFKLWFLEGHGCLSLEGMDVLEFGCGHGRMALETRGYSSYVGVDFVEQLVNIGRRRLE